MQIKELGSVIVGAGKTVGKLTWAFPALHLQKRRALRLFREGLRGQGLTEEAIAAFTKAYLELGDPRKWISGAKED